jgi:4'-phosphopantetheinyl transferase
MVRVFARAIRGVPNNALYADLIPLLSPRKRERVCRLVRGEDVVRALAGERLIRDIIKQDIGVDGAAVQIDTNKYGKPFVVGYPGFNFNLSHSGLWVVCAVGRNPVGIDVERERDVDRQTAATFFSKEEQQYLSTKPAKDWQSHFYRLWTLKESFVKCEGKGFFTDPASFTIKIEDDGIYLKSQSGTIDGRYRFRIFDLDRGYALAGCSEGEDFANEAMKV